MIAIDNTKIINLTPHPVVLFSEYNHRLLKIPASNNPARVVEQQLKNRAIPYKNEDGRSVSIPNATMVLRNTKNLPKPDENTIFIVSRVVAEFADDRNDLFIPYGLVKDNHNKIIGCQCLMRIRRGKEGR